MLAGMDGEEGLEDQRVLAGRRRDGVRDGVFRVEVEPRGDVPELQVQVHDHHAHGRDSCPGRWQCWWRWWSLPTPPLGEKTPITSALVALGLLDCRGPADGWRRTGRPAPAAPGSGRGRTDGLRMSRIPARMASRMKAGSGSPTRRTLRSGTWTSKHGGEAQGVVDRNIRAEDQDLRALLVQAGEQFVRIGRD